MSTFCVACGAQLGRRCPFCGVQAQPEDAFCGACGYPLRPIAPASGDADSDPLEAALRVALCAQQALHQLLRTAGHRLQAPSPPDQSVPPSPQARAVKMGEPAARPEQPPAEGEKKGALLAALASQRRPVTILMADITGYSALSETMEADWVYEIIDEVLRELSDCLESHGAYIDKYVGDEIVALFGAEQAVEDAADRAVLAALAMFPVMDRLNVRNRNVVGIDMDLHVGVNLGMVVAGRVGHQTVGGTTAIGDAVNVAKRLETEADAGEIYISEEVRKRLRGRYNLKPLGEITIKNRKAPVVAYSVLRDAEPLTELAVEPEMVWVGRDRLLQQVGDAALVSETGDADCVLVVGDAGVGKTELVRHYLADWEKDDGLVVEIGCTSFSAESPHWVLGELVLLILTEVVGTAAPGSPEVLSFLEEAMGEDKDALPAVLEVLSLRQGGLEERQAASPGLLTLGFTHLLLRVCSTRRLCIFIDNAHWLDEASVRVFAEVGSRLGSRDADPRPLWFLCGTDEENVVLASRWRPAVIGVPSLTEAEADAILAEIPETRALTHEQRRSISAKSQGNARCLVEMVRWVCARRDEKGRIDEIPPSLSVTQAVLSRVEALPHPLPLLLQACAVIGEPLVPALIQQLVSHEVASVENLLELCHRGFPEVARRSYGEFRFANRLAAEVVYDAIPAPRRRELHSLVAEHLKGLGAEASHVHMLARHAYRAGWREDAIPYLMASAKSYNDESSHHECVRAVHHAIEAIANADDPETWVDRRIMALVLQARSQDGTGEVDQARAALEEADRLLDGRAFPELSAHVSLERGNNALYSGRLDGAIDAYERASKAWRDLGARHREAHAVLGIGMTYQFQEQWEEAEAYCRKALEIDHDEVFIRSAALNNLGHVLHQRGALEEASLALLEAEGLMRKESDLRGLAHCLASHGELLLVQGKPEMAIRKLVEAVAAAREVDDPPGACTAGALLARCHLACERREEARMALDEVVVYRGAVRDPQASADLEDAYRELAEADEAASH